MHHLDVNGLYGLQQIRVAGFYCFIPPALTTLFCVAASDLAPFDLELDAFSQLQLLPMNGEALQASAAFSGALSSFPAGSPPPLSGFTFAAGLNPMLPSFSYPLTPSIGSGEPMMLLPLPSLSALPQPTTIVPAPNHHTAASASKKQLKKKGSAKSSKKKTSKSKQPTPIASASAAASIEAEELDPTDEYQRFLQQFSESAAAPLTPAAAGAGMGMYVSASQGTAAAGSKGLDEYVPDAAPAPVRFERRKDLVVSVREISYINQPDTADAATSTPTPTPAPAPAPARASSSSSSSSAASRASRAGSKAKSKKFHPNPALTQPTFGAANTSATGTI